MDVLVYGLRRKLEDDPANPEQLVTVRSYGYKWVPRDSPPRRSEEAAPTQRSGIS